MNLWMRDLPPNVLRRIHVADSGCWLWTGYLNPAGYGRTKVGGKPWLAHRFTYEYLRGPIPDGLDIDHLCRVRHCVNPAHLEPVTRRENLLRGDTVVARRARQTQCMRGHEFTSENTARSKAGTRQCIACGRIRAQRTRDRARHMVPA